MFNRNTNLNFICSGKLKDSISDANYTCTLSAKYTYSFCNLDRFENNRSCTSSKTLFDRSLEKVIDDRYLNGRH